MTKVGAFAIQIRNFSQPKDEAVSLATFVTYVTLVTYVHLSVHFFMYK